jgi:hypothetical protein
METVFSVNGVPIRLTDERWRHIVEEHSDLSGRMFEVLETLWQPREVRIGRKGELWAIKETEPGKDLVVIYKEVSLWDGFVITAFSSKRRAWIERRKKAWPPSN